ncbi:nuclear transport factor 2 family protein [Polyangium aurulentum]|uniref:nuclear transport factor 2 family protein n=1 Tax=Polyangium aurulentum TaxID=2567896 RepID=UPI00146B35E6|nr:nuclear transport factor 2 family protein [Polyangium aurulentum]UQA55333.1 nuclear transport factor 2 family protein [Polyangium aurulentum]
MTETEARQLITEYFRAAVCEPDPDVYLSLLTPDAVLEDPVGTPPYRGRDAIARFLRPSKATIERGEFSVGEIFACGNECTARWTVRAWFKTGQHVVIEGTGLFVFDEERKIRQIREFWDSPELKALMSGA